MLWKRKKFDILRKCKRKAMWFFRYIEWASHEPQPGIYLFENNLDIQNYFKLAQEFNLSVILRPGPYIDAERDMVCRL